MGPVIGEMVASLVGGTVEPDPTFSLGRFKRPSANLTPEKWE
jgi:hypothetical protein